MLGFLRSKDKSYLDSEDQNDPERETDLWYERECINVSAAFSRVLDDNGIEATFVLGLFHSPERSWGFTLGSNFRQANGSTRPLPRAAC